MSNNKNGRSPEAQARHEARVAAFQERQRMTHPSQRGDSLQAGNNAAMARRIASGKSDDQIQREAFGA